MRSQLALPFDQGFKVNFRKRRHHAVIRCSCGICCFSWNPSPFPRAFGQTLLRLALATLLGAVIGINRELRHKAAGLRTLALVALGAALVALIGLYLTDPSELNEASGVGRVIQGIVAGNGDP